MTDEKFRLQKHPGYRIYSPVIADDCDRPYADMEACPEGQWVRIADYDALAARLAEAERLLRVAYSLHGTIKAAAVSHDFQMQYVRFLNHREATSDSAPPATSAEARREVPD